MKGWLHGNLAPVWPDEELTQHHIHLDTLGKTDFSEFLLLRHNHKESQFMSREAFPKKLNNLMFDYFLLTMITLQSVTDTARQTFDCFFLH